MRTQVIYCGDNLRALRGLPDESVDLVYIDPPLVVLPESFKTCHAGAKEDREKCQRYRDEWHEPMEKYVDMMYPRVAELWRLLKSTGSLYYHCDWRVDAYARMMLDKQFGPSSFRSQIIWRRTQVKRLSLRTFQNSHDSILLYTKTGNYAFTPQYLPLDENHLSGSHSHVEPDTSRRYRLLDLTNPSKERPNLTYEFLGVIRTWRWPKERMQEAYEKGLVVQARPGAVPALKRYLDEEKGTLVDSIWIDIPPVRATSGESLGYPTQKPLDLLERIILASSNEQDVILDAFCGAGTTLHAAQILGRQWVGIDISSAACRMAAHRLERQCHLKQGIDFSLQDLPKSLEDLQEYSPLEFESWALIALGAAFADKRVSLGKASWGDSATDVCLYPATVTVERESMPTDRLENWYPVQVKQRDRVTRHDISSFETIMRRLKRNKGFYVSFSFSSDAKEEIYRARCEESLYIFPITVKELLENQLQT